MLRASRGIGEADGAQRGAHCRDLAIVSGQHRVQRMARYEAREIGVAGGAIRRDAGEAEGERERQCAV